MIETIAPAPSADAVAAPAVHPDVSDVVYLAGPIRIHRSAFWLEAVEALRQRFAKHRVIVAGDGSFKKHVPTHEMKALALIVPPDRLVGYGSFLETSRALRSKRPVWAYIDGELHDSFAMRLNAAESLINFARVEPSADGCVHVDRYAKPPQWRPKPQAAEPTEALAS